MLPGQTLPTLTSPEYAQIRRAETSDIPQSMCPHGRTAALCPAHARLCLLAPDVQGLTLRTCCTHNTAQRLSYWPNAYPTGSLFCPCSTSSDEELQLLQTQARDASAALAAWLEGHALQRWAGVLTAAEVDLALLPTLTDCELQQVRQSLPCEMRCPAACP